MAGEDRHMKRIELAVNELDYDAIQEALSRRQSLRVLPDSDSDLTGLLIAEICRGYVEMLNNRPPRDEGDDWKYA